MDRTAVLQRLRDVGVIPVVRATSADEALRLCAAITAGDLPVLEVTLTVPGALQVIEQLVRRDPRVLVGAGSVLDAKAARAAIAAGAQFVVSPALCLDVVAQCRKQDVAVLPGALTSTEVLQAAQAGADFVKVFPAGALGGASYVRALKGPLPHVDLVPTGGVTLETAGAFIEAGAAAIGVGSDLASVEALRRDRADRITDLARAYVKAVRAARAGASSGPAGDRSSARPAGTGTARPA